MGSPFLNRNMKKLRAAIAGCGLIGSEFSDTSVLPGTWSHAEAYKNCPDIELVSVNDTAPDKLERCMKRWNVDRGYLDFSEMLEQENPEIISICTPDKTHSDLIGKALFHRSIKAIFAEKPLALDHREAENLVSIAQERGVILAVNYSRRYAPGFLHLKERMSSGMLGKIQAVTGYYTRGVLHNGSHWFDLANFLLGPAGKIDAFDRLGERTDDPTLDVFIEFENGASGFLKACDASSFAIFEMDIIGSKGRIRIVDSGFVIEHYRLEDSPFGAGYRTLVPSGKSEGGLGDALPNAVINLVRCLKEGSEPLSSGVSALSALSIGLAARNTAKARSCR